MQEADILAETYWDTVTVYRPFKDTLPSGESVFKSGAEGEDGVSGMFHVRYLLTAAEHWPRAAPRHLQILPTAFL